MRLIKICLGPNKPFWFWNNIYLTPEASVSSFFDVDKLDLEASEILEKSIQRQEIKAFDNNKNQIFSLGSHNLLGGEIPLEFIEEEIEVSETEIPEMISITCVDDEPKEEIILTEEDYDQARLILNKNGNTVRKVVAEFLVNKDTISLLKACLELELESKNRKGIINILNKKIEDYNES